jgi:hypothetical protein
MLEGRGGDASRLFAEADEFWRRYEARSRWAREAAQWRERARPGGGE